MAKRRKAKRSKLRRPSKEPRRQGGGREWIGGRLTPPFFITDRDEPYRPGLVVWMDVRDGLVVTQSVVGPEDTDGAVGRALLDAIEHPLAGPPRRPDRIRVADASLAAEVRAALGDTAPVDIAPTPELDELLELMLESMQGEDENASYLEEGRVSPAALGGLFTVAEILYRLAPWQVATDDQVLRIDIPAWGVEGACVSIIGNLGESLGLMIFPSLEGYEAFVLAAERLPSGANARLDFGTDWMALSFERGADLPAAMRREVADHGWPVADAKAYPRIDRCERDGAPRPLVDQDIEIVTACAASLAAFYAKHPELFEGDDFEPVCESFFNERELEVTVTMPYEAFELFDVNDGADSPGPLPEAKKVGRNAPCPCGSGKKYKKCHLPREEAERAGNKASVGGHGLDAQLVRALSEFAMRRFGFEWRAFTKDFVDASEALQLAVPWSIYHYHVRGKTILDHYLEGHGRQLMRAKRQWLMAQKASWLSAWEVVDVEPGETLTLRDLLSHEERSVREASGSKTLVKRDVLLGRVVDREGESLMCGAHPRPLPPLEAAEVVRRARGRLRRKRAVPVERLREEAFGRYLIKRWEEAVEALDRRAAIPPRLQNTDGDPLLLTTDHFEIAPGGRAETLARLAEMEGVDFDDTEEQADPEYVFLSPGNPIHKSWEVTVVGRARVVGDTLRLETNSRERADALRTRIEAACAGLVRHRVREHSDPASPSAQSEAIGSRSPLPAPPPPEAAQLLLDFKRRHFTDWLDQPLPALGGKSPREAVATAQGRGAVDVLLKDIENREQRSSGPDTFDIGELRRELRLE